MKLGFNKFLEKKFGSEFKEKRESMIKQSEEKAKTRDLEIQKIQSGQKGILKDMVKEENVLYLDGVPYHKTVWKCDNILDNKKICGKEVDLVSELYFGKIPPMLSSDLKLDRKMILDFLQEHTIIRHVMCSCGKRISIANRIG
jgi:translation initiation factor 2 beta subunit (eIF-2beta)/eIF-5